MMRPKNFRLSCRISDRTDFAPTETTGAICRLAPRCSPSNVNAAAAYGRYLTPYHYSCRAGCQWHSLPVPFPPWSACTTIFGAGNSTSCGRASARQSTGPRLTAGRVAAPALVCLGSQSVRPAPCVFEHRGLDWGKQVKGRKHQIINDVQGQLFACRVPRGQPARRYRSPTLAARAPCLGTRLRTVGQEPSGLFRPPRHSPGACAPNWQAPAGGPRLRPGGQTLGRGAHLRLAHKLPPDSLVITGLPRVPTKPGYSSPTITTCRNRLVSV